MHQAQAFSKEQERTSNNKNAALGRLTLVSVQDILSKLAMKSHMHLGEISFFKLTKIFHRADKNWAHLKKKKSKIKNFIDKSWSPFQRKKKILKIFNAEKWPEVCDLR